MGCPMPILPFHHVQVDFLSSMAGYGLGVPTPTTGAEVLVNLVFHVVVGRWPGFDESGMFGGINIMSGNFQLGNGSHPPLTIASHLPRMPKPTTGLRLAIGILGLCGVSRRERAR